MNSKGRRSIGKQRQLWSALSRSWEKWEHFVFAPRRDLHLKIIKLAEIRNGFRVLDFATGAGEPGLTTCMEAPHSEVIGCDVSGEMLAVAERRAQRENCPNFKTKQLNNLTLPFPECAFDAVLCCFGLEFVEDPSALMAEIHRVLKRGRKFAASTWGPIDQNPIQSIVLKEIESIKPGNSPPITTRFSNPQSICEIMLHAGFSEISVESYAGAFVFDNSQQLWEFKIEVSPIIAERIDELSSKELASVQKLFLKCCEIYAHGSGKIVVPYQAWVLSGTRS